VAINTLALGGTTFLLRKLIEPMEQAGKSTAAPTFSSFQAAWFDYIPVLGGLLKDQNWFVLLALISPFVVQFALYKTRWGLRVMAVGNDSVKAKTMGVPVRQMRYSGVLLSGVLAGLAGAFLTLGSVPLFKENITAGKGFIALAALIFGRWTPMGAFAAAFGFGFFQALQDTLQSKPLFGIKLPEDVVLMLPYLLTIIALFGLFGKMKPPSDLGNP
jgi:simple sugar transport system permease protein